MRGGSEHRSITRLLLFTTQSAEHLTINLINMPNILQFITIRQQFDFLEGIYSMVLETDSKFLFSTQHIFTNITLYNFST